MRKKTDFSISTFCVPGDIYVLSHLTLCDHTMRYLNMSRQYWRRADKPEGWITWPRSHSYWVVETGFELRHSSSRGHKVLFLPSKGLCFPESCRSSIVKSHWPSKSDSLGIPCPLARSPGWEAWHEAQNIHNSGRTSLVFFFSSLWVAHLESMRFDFNVIAPLLPSHCGFSIVLECGVFFLGGFQHPAVDGHSAASFDFGVLREEEHTSFYSTIMGFSPGAHIHNHHSLQLPYTVMSKESEDCRYLAWKRTRTGMNAS